MNRAAREGQGVDAGLQRGSFGTRKTGLGTNLTPAQPLYDAGCKLLSPACARQLMWCVRHDNQQADHLEEGQAERLLLHQIDIWACRRARKECRLHVTGATFLVTFGGSDAAVNAPDVL